MIKKIIHSILLFIISFSFSCGIYGEAIVILDGPILGMESLSGGSLISSYAKNIGTGEARNCYAFIDIISSQTKEKVESHKSLVGNIKPNERKQFEVNINSKFGADIECKIRFSWD